MSVFKSFQKNETDTQSLPSKKASIFKSIPHDVFPKKEKLPEKPGLEYFTEDEDLQRQIERGTAQNIQALIEGTAGLPGNIANFINQSTGGKVKEFTGLSSFLPTSEKIKEFGEKATLGYTKPQNKFEEIGKEFMSDIGASLPFGGASNVLRGGKVLNNLRLWQPILTPFLGQSAKQASKSFGSDEKSGDLWKIGSMIVTDVLLNRGLGSKNYINHLFQEAENSISPGIKTNANNLKNSLISTRTELERGGTSPTTTEALKKIDEALNKIHGSSGNYTIEVTELPAFRRNINAVRGTLGGWKSEVPIGHRKEAIRNLEKVKTNIIDAGMEYGNTHNPKFAEYWSAANEASNIASKSNLATRFLENTIGKKLFGKIIGGGIGTHAAGSAIGGAASGQPVIGSLLKTGLVAGGTALVGKSLYETGKLAYRMTKSPVLKTYYSELMKAAALQDGPRVVKYSSKIEKELEKEDKKEKVLIQSILKD